MVTYSLGNAAQSQWDKNSWVWSPQEQQPAEKVTYERGIGDDIHSELNVAEERETEGRHNVIKDSELSKEQSPWVAEEWFRKLEKYWSAQRRSAFDLWTVKALKP